MVSRLPNPGLVLPISQYDLAAIGTCAGGIAQGTDVSPIADGRTGLARFKAANDFSCGWAPSGMWSNARASIGKWSYDPNPVGHELTAFDPLANALSLDVTLNPVSMDPFIWQNIFDTRTKGNIFVEFNIKDKYVDDSIELMIMYGWSGLGNTLRIPTLWEHYGSNQAGATHLSIYPMLNMCFAIKNQFYTSNGLNLSFLAGKACDQWRYGNVFREVTITGAAFGVEVSGMIMEVYFDTVDLKDASGNFGGGTWVPGGGGGVKKL